MSRRDGSCWRHPAQRAAGVCADCLKERLSALSPTPTPIPLTSATSSTRGLEQQQPLYLRRSKSWSHWEGAGAGGASTSSSIHQQFNGLARKSDAVLDDWTRQRFFSIFASQQKQRKQLPNTNTNNVGGYELRHPASSRAWQPHVAEPQARVTILENGSLEDERTPASSSAAAPPKSRKPSSWWASLLNLAFRKPKSGEKQQQKKKSTTIASYFKSSEKWKASNRGISSPLRLFKSSSNEKRGSKEVAPKQKQKAEEPSSWSIPSSTELRRIHHPAGYTTAYYRDYGAWSLSSSPVPNNRWSNGGRGKQQPWENRDVVAAAHSSSSPYHQHNSTWNFYLTPLRPAKVSAAAGSSTSKHRK